MTLKSVDQVTQSKPLTSLGMEELAARQRNLKRTSGGILFARNTDGDAKTMARQKILELFSCEQWPGSLHMLTLPGLQWRFERKLLGMREQGWMQYKPEPKQTYFTGCESDRSIYYAAVPQMPGLHTPNSLLRRVKTFNFAEMGVKTKYATLFFANVDDLMRQNYWDRGWDAVWLDYTGPLSIERMNLIRRFYQKYVRTILVVTALKARWETKTSKAIIAAGGHTAWLREYLEGEILHTYEYEDTSPMAQFAIRKTWKSPLV